MFGSDACFRVVTRKSTTFRGATEPRQTASNFVLIPERSILLLEEQQAAAAVLPRRQAGTVQKHQGQQRERFRCRAHRMLREDFGQAPRFIAELAADGTFRVRGEIALGEE